MPKKDTPIREIDNLVFVGRETYIRKFWDTLRSHAEQGKEQHHILVYYGVGGIGKSRLQEQLIRELADGINYLPARVNLADLVATNDAPAILYQLRDELRQASPAIPFPRFDHAYLVYYAKFNRPRVS